MSFIQVLGELRKKCNSDLGGFARLEKSTFVEDWVKWEAWRRDNAGLANAKAANNAETQLFSELQKRYVFLQKAYTLKYMSIYKRDEFLSRWNSLYGQLKPADNRERAVCDQLYRIYVEKYAGSLFDLASSNGDRFVQMWRNGENIKFQKIIKTADDRMLYQRLFDTFMLVSENKINAQRDAAKKRFDSQRQSIINKQLRSQKNAEYAAKRKRYQEREAAAERLSLSSEQEYIKDLPRKMARLDVALLAVGTNRKNWNLLIKELKWARQEKTRLKDHPELHNAAELLIEYADIVERIAEQGRYFTDTVLARQTMRGKFVEDEKRMVTVIQSNARLLVLRDLQKAVPGGRPQKVESVRLDLVKGNIKFNNQWIRSVETLCGRSDQYFYYMMFNGYWQDCRDLEEIAPVADRQYWRNRNIENMAYNCFKLMLWQTNNDGVEALKRRFNSWKIFHKALNDFQSEMR